jgi:hypothetical protein
VLRAKAVDRHVIGREVRRDHAVGDVLDTRTLDTSRGALPLRIRVEHDRDHHRRVIRCTTPAVLAIARVERRQIDVLDGVDHEPRQMVLRQPLAQRGRHQQQLLTITLDEVLSHAQKCLNRGGRTGGLRNSLRAMRASASSGVTLAHRTNRSCPRLRHPHSCFAPAKASVCGASGRATEPRPLRSRGATPPRPPLRHRSSRARSVICVDGDVAERPRLATASGRRGRHRSGTRCLVG